MPCAAFSRKFLLILLLSTAGSVSAAQAQPTARMRSTIGCWRLSRPLGPTGGALAPPRDAPWTVAILRDSGRVVLPLLSERERNMWEKRSYWAASGDSVDFTAFTGLQGWRARLSVRALPDSMRGHATYLSDAIVVGQSPMRVPVTLTRIVCDKAWSTLPVTTRVPRSWERGEPLYFDFQVERPAALVPGAKLPPGVRSMRSLARDETVEPSSARSNDVVVQMVIQATGRVDTSSVQLLLGAGEKDLSSPRRDRVAAMLAAVRFTPPMVDGRAVNQLAQWRIIRN